MDNIRDILDKLNKLSGDVNRLEGKVDSLTESVNKLEGKVDSLTESVNKLEDTEKDEKIAELNDIIQMIDENAKALTFSRKLTNKELVADMKGDKHPRYKNNVNNDELIKDYESGMILRELSEKYGMTIQGIKNRLISLGVYKKVYKK